MRLLDLFCGAGGAAMGYYRAGFDEIVGIDIVPQPHFPFEFVQADALEYVAEHGTEFDMIHASPPCQAYSSANNLWDRDYPDLIDATRAALEATGKPYVIENVPGSPLAYAVKLRGDMFGLLVERERWFETSPPMLSPVLPPFVGDKAKMGRRPKPGQYISVVGHFIGVQYARDAMGIDWMTGAELSQAIPPAYTEYIGRRMLELIGVAEP